MALESEDSKQMQSCGLLWTILVAVWWPSLEKVYQETGFEQLLIAVAAEMVTEFQDYHLRTLLSHGSQFDDHP